jgi:hypothetical protein
MFIVAIAWVWQTSEKLAPVAAEPARPQRPLVAPAPLAPPPDTVADLAEPPESSVAAPPTEQPKPALVVLPEAAPPPPPKPAKKPAAAKAPPAEPAPPPAPEPVGPTEAELAAAEAAALAAAAPEPPPPVPQATLAVVLKSSVKEGRLSLFLDGKTIYTADFTGRGGAPRQPTRVSIPAGKHTVAAQLSQTGKDREHHDSIEVDLAPGSSATLRVAAGRALGRDLSLPNAGSALFSPAGGAAPRGGRLSSRKWHPRLDRLRSAAWATTVAHSTMLRRPTSASVRYASR